MDQGNKSKKINGLHIDNEPVRYAITAARLGPLEQRLCQPYFENLDKWHSAVFVRAPWLPSPSQLDFIPGVRNSLKHKRIVRIISVQSNDQYPRALRELVIFAHSKINNHIQQLM